MAFRDHGVAQETLTQDVAAAQEQLIALQGLGIDLEQIGQDLQTAGLSQFEKAYADLLTLVSTLRLLSRRSLGNGRQAMALPRPIAGLINNTQRRPGIELVARGRSVDINAALHPLSNLSGQSNATRGCLIGTLHPHQLGGKYDGHLHRHTDTLRGLGQFGRMEVHTIRSTASAATFTYGRR